MISELIYKVPEKYKFIYEERRVKLPNDINQEIEKNWVELMDSGKKYTNGDLYTVSNISYDEEKSLIFKILKTDYAHYLYTSKNNFQGDHICRSIAVSALFLTNDNYYVLGEMSSSTALDGKIKFVGGAISNEDIINNEFYHLDCIKREVDEELGLKLDDKSKTKDFKEELIITRKNLSFINICYKVNLNLSSKEIMDLFNDYKNELLNKNMESELENIILVKNEVNSLEKFISENKLRMLDYMEDTFLVLTNKNNLRDFEMDIK